MTFSRTAVILALSTASISGFSNFFAKTAVTVVNDPVTFTFLKNAIVGILLIGIMVIASRSKEISNLNASQWRRLILIGIIGGSIPFVLFFTGLTLTSAVTASFIHKTLFLWVAVLAVPLLKERIGWMQGAAFMLLIGGNFALGMKDLSLGKGELMIFGATILWAVENIIAKKALAELSSLTVAGARMVFGSLLLLGVVLFQGKAHLISGLSAQQWWWTILPAVLLLGYVVTWYSALKRAPATLVACLLVPATLVTNVLSQIFLDKTMSAGDIINAVLVIAASVLIIIGFRYGRTTEGLAVRRSEN